jgi:Domain of unknown function (DUF1707)
MNDDHLRMSDEERERAAAELAEHYVRGRLDSAEHAERLDRVWAARTRGELAPVFRDLPGEGYGRGPRLPRPPFGAPVAAWPPAVPVARRRGGLPTPVVAVLGVLLVMTVLTHLPFFLLALVLWLVLRSHGRRSPGPWRHQYPARPGPGYPGTSPGGPGGPGGPGWSGGWQRRR